MMKYCLWIMFALMNMAHSLVAVSSQAAWVSVRGYLGSDQVAAIQTQVDNANAGANTPLILEIESSTGDLRAVLGLAQHIYELKLQKGFRVIALLSSKVVGPAATLPFLADELIATPYVSWGAIPQGSESSVSLNVLRNQVLGLITPSNPKAGLLQLLAQAMVDDSIFVVDDHGWKLVREMPSSTATAISHKGETLVVSHLQLRQLGLVRRFESISDLRQQYGLQPEEPVGPVEDLEAATASTLQKRLTDHIHFDPAKPTTIGHILIDDRTSGINQGTWLYVKTALDHYKLTKPAFVILELNTPGGEVYAAELISEALKSLDIDYGIPVVAYIDNWAMSAGALLAYSCRFIAIAKDASMGAAEPVIQSAEGKMEEASEKVNSAMRSDMANRANFFARNPLLAEAMVDKDVILVLRHGKIVKLDNEDQIRKGSDDPDMVISPKGKLLTLNAEDLMKYGVADILVPPVAVKSITTTEEWEGHWPASKMALFTTPFFDKLEYATIDSYRPDWRVQFLSILTMPAVSSILMLGLMLGFYMEMSHPGFGLAGGVALTCLFLILLSSFALEAINWLDIIILLAGVMLVGIELFVLPTFGVAGFFGIAMVIFGLFSLTLPNLQSVSFDYDTGTWNAAGEVFVQRLVWLCGSLVVAIILAALLGKYVVPRVAGMSRLVLNSEQQGYIAGVDPKTLPPAGTEGVVAATLRPSGKIMINDTIYDAVSDGAFIEKGTAIFVSRLDGSKIVVAELLEEMDTP